VAAFTVNTRPDRRWLLTAVNRVEDSLELQSVGVRLTPADLYDKVDLTQTAD